MVDIEPRTHRGWELLRLVGEELELELVPALGGTITSLRRRRDDAQVLAATPWGLRHRGSASVPGNSEAVMVDSSPGGWLSVFPNGGDTAIVHGVEWGYDGEARVTWLDWAATDSGVALTGRLVRSPFELTKTVRLDGPSVTVEETVRNVGREAVETMWASRLMLGGDLVGPDTVVNAMAAVVRPDLRYSNASGHEDLLPWPRAYGARSLVNLRSVPGPDAGETRSAYVTDFGQPLVRVNRASRGLSVELEWDDETMPYLWYQLEAGGTSGFPWYGAGYHLSLAPSSSWPSHGLHDVRRVSDTTVFIQPGEERTSRVSLRLG